MNGEGVRNGKHIAKKMSAAMGEIGVIQKDKSNDHFNYKYASAEAVLRKVSAVCSKYSIAVSNSTERLNEFTSGRAFVKSTLTFIDGDSGDWMTSEGYGESLDKGDKASSKAHTVSIKYAVAAAFLIAWSEDDPEADAKVDKSAELIQPVLDMLSEVSSEDGLKNVVEQMSVLKKNKAVIGVHLEDVRVKYAQKMAELKSKAT